MESYDEVVAVLVGCLDWFYSVRPTIKSFPPAASSFNLFGIIFSRLLLHAALYLGILCDHCSFHGYQGLDGSDGLEHLVRLVSAQQGSDRQLLVRIAVQGHVPGESGSV